MSVATAWLPSFTEKYNLFLGNYLEKISQEQDITSATHIRRDKAIEGHEERIVRLEKKTGIEQVVVS